MNKITDILITIPNLSQKELRQVRDRINFFYKENQDENNLEESLFYKSISLVLTEKIGIEVLTFSVFKKSKHYKKFKEAFSFIKAYSAKLLKDRNNKRNRLCFDMLFAEIMIKYLEKYELQKDIVVLLNAYPKYPGQLNLAYPGYIELGLFPMILKNYKI